MIKKISALGVLLYLASCSPTTTEAVVENVSEVAAPTGEAAQGKTIYEEKCQKCHKLKIIDNYSTERWSEVLPVMAEKAKLEGSEETLIGQYVNWELSN